MTINEMIDHFQIQSDFMFQRIRVKQLPDLTPEIFEEIKAKKPEILQELKRLHDEKNAPIIARQKKIDAIEGLAEIRTAQDDLARWHEEFNASFEGPYAVGGMGVRPKPQHDIPAMMAQYPRAAAWIRAESYQRKNNYELSAIGKRACDEILDGDWEKAMADMDKALDEFAAQHAWD